MGAVVGFLRLCALSALVVGGWAVALAAAGIAYPALMILADIGGIVTMACLAAALPTRLTDWIMNYGAKQPTNGE